MNDKRPEIDDFNDKYKKENGREASEQGKDTQFLDKEALEDDLIDVPDPEKGNHGQILNPDHPENQEWNVREEQNRYHQE